MKIDIIKFVSFGLPFSFRKEKVSGFGLPPEKIMRLAPSAFGGGSPNALLAPLKREVVSLRPVYIVRNFYHSLFLLSDDMGAVFINTIMQKESTCLSEFGVTNETKTDSRILFVPLVTPFFTQISTYLPYPCEEA